ncbi:sugar nucleotide-binding protein [Maridesulfovibrio sp.]|uniref:sugar nucleotide-binding protein n=1 Tax=Maridesulfovibrio sp. TaxID=2795000 RepID=UPI0039EE15AD
MKILVIGDGALGNAIAGLAEKSGHETFQTSRKNSQLLYLDLKEELKFTDLPDTDWAVIAAGISGYKECAENQHSRKVNVERTIELCRALLARGTKILFPSSTAVFDGETPSPAPDTNPCPSTEYGHQKTEVENFLRTYPKQTAIVRLTKLLERNTPLITGWLENLAAGRQITPFKDLTIAPVHFEDAALACCRIMENNGSGIFHCSGPQEISYLEFAQRICRQSGFDSRLITPGSCKGFLDYCPAHCALESGATEEFIKFNFPAADRLIEEILRPRCLLCGSGNLHIFEQRQNFPGITSDCKPWPRAGGFILCKDCGHAQKDISPQWLSDINKIYSGYEMYPLSNGSEPLIFDENGHGRPRSGILLDRLIHTHPLPEDGTMLDVGCGNGSLLQQFHLRRPGWKLCGHEQSVQREEILHLPGVENFYSGSFDKIGRKFDLITLTYVIEHLTDPVSALKKLAGLLREGGLIMVHTSSFAENPFDLMVCDHCSHFTPDSLEFLAKQSGLDVTAKTDSWLTKEIGITARKGSSLQERVPAQKHLQVMKDTLDWLGQLAHKAGQASAKYKTGIFGTAVAGTWLAATLKEQVSFFVDEDPSKQGQSHMGLPILGPEMVPPDAAVVMGFNKELGSHIAQRLNGCYPRIKFIIPDI